MRSQELELWTREIIDTVKTNEPVEDSRVELKATWIEPEAAARRLAGHANAARGEPILWLIGIDERNRKVTGVDALEFENWFKRVQKHFDSYAPSLLIHINIKVDSETVVALYLETERYAPFIVKNPKGGYPEYEVPWREATRLRAAKREELLRILIPIRRLSALKEELDYNAAIAKSVSSTSPDSWGTPFREKEFYRALRDGALATLPSEVRELLYEAYIVMGRSNQVASGALNTQLTGRQRQDVQSAARKKVQDSLAPITSASHALLIDAARADPANTGPEDDV